MLRARGGSLRGALIPNGLRQYRRAGGSKGRGGRTGAGAAGGSSSGPGEGQPAGLRGWHDAARSDGRTAGPVEAVATAEITEPASIRSPAWWEGESDTEGSSPIGAAGSEGSCCRVVAHWRTSQYGEST